MDDLVLEIKNISKSFVLRHRRTDSLKEALGSLFSSAKGEDSRFTALNNVSFNLKQGEALGIIGENGAGKSTLLRVLAGIIPPDEGEIIFYGRAVSILEVGTGFNPELTGRENIYLSASLYHFSRKKIEERFDEIVEFSGIGEFLDEAVKTYSSGMYLRLAFSLITCLDADIYLIDEVISVGDANFQVKCKKRMEDLIAMGKTLVIASHNMNEIVTLCNRVISLEKGGIVQEGNFEVIQKYMVHALPQYFSFGNGVFYQMKNLVETIPKGLGVLITQCSLEAFTPGVEGISIEHSFKIVIGLELTRPAHYIIRMRVYEVSGVLVFVCSTLKNSIQLNAAGKYQATFEIPGHIFNESMYWFDFALINAEEQTILFSESKFLTIKMASDKPVDSTERRAYLPGVMKPLYRSETKSFIS